MFRESYWSYEGPLPQPIGDRKDARPSPQGHWEVFNLTAGSAPRSRTSDRGMGCFSYLKNLPGQLLQCTEQREFIGKKVLEYFPRTRMGAKSQKILDAVKSVLLGLATPQQRKARGPSRWTLGCRMSKWPARKKCLFHIRGTATRETELWWGGVTHKIPEDALSLSQTQVLSVPV